MDGQDDQTGVSAHRSGEGQPSDWSAAERALTSGLARLGSRARGFVVGAMIGGPLALVEAIANLFDGSGLSFGLGALVAGSLGGWLFGPLAVRAESKRRRAFVVIAFAIFATIVAAVVVAEALGFRDAPPNLGMSEIVDRAFDSLNVAGIGILIIGPLTAPIVLAAAAIWSAIVRAAEQRSHVTFTDAD